MFAANSDTIQTQICMHIERTTLETGRFADESLTEAIQMRLTKYVCKWPKYGRGMRFQ